MMDLDHTMNITNARGDISAHLESHRRPFKVYEEVSNLSIFEIERVKDWNKRIEGYNESQKNKYKLAFEKMAELKIALEDREDWDLTIDKKKD